jgi:hypothetical protein
MAITTPVIGSTGWGAVLNQALVDLDNAVAALTLTNYSEIQSLTGYPTTFPPATHGHAATAITGLAAIATSGAFGDLGGTQFIGASVWDGTTWSSERGDALLWFWVGGDYPADTPASAAINDIWYPETVV